MKIYHIKKGPDFYNLVLNVDNDGTKNRSVTITLWVNRNVNLK